MKRKLALIGMALAGKLITLYLTITHLRGVDPVCPIFGASGCAIATTSTYAKLGPVPVALLGFIVWVLLLYFAIQHYRAARSLWPMLGLSALGVAAAGYFNAIMLVRLENICFWCETSHALMIGVFFVAAYSLFGERKNWAAKTGAVAAALFFVPFLVAVQATPDPATLALAECLTEKNVTMYGAFWCPHCKEQKNLFGAAFDSLNYVECALPNNPNEQVQACKDAGIKGYPTWIRGDGERLFGTIDLGRLKAWAQC